MNKQGYSLLEIIVAITIFSIFAVAITIAFSTYTDISKNNNIIATERIEIVSNLEKFLSNKDVKDENLSNITLVKKEGLKDLPKEIACLQKEQISEKSNEKLKAFIKKPDKK
ncbi:prepilin-type N-terminal cleavage/methylation domain-containing protein [uncultured Tyzzerella sp.]|uniref:type II secretion system protein n=1 Tax=uncultured Tyzzerella sp. TaxID=2321398 RepID=UPI002942DB31|nr:prepilin-type N-terminal cleavage/methylation domain-containing protein [uncultured Tyzzerella sp.]